MIGQELAAAMGAGIYAKPLGVAMKRWGVDAPRDQARFLAQTSVESAGFKRIVESLRYKPQRLVDVFGSRNGLTLALATILCAKGEQAIANHVYGGAWGLKNLGNVGPDDGWLHRGSGLIMTTGLSNFRDTALRTGNDEILKNPDVLRTSPDVAADAAACFWYSKKLNGIDDIAVLTKRVNGGQMALQERVAETNRAYSLL